MHIPSLSFSLTGLSLLSTAVAHPHYAQQARQVQRRQDADASQRAEAVKEAFQFAWNGYYRYAFPHDELHPVTNGYGDSRNGWGASAIDALSTALVMRLPDVVDDILKYVPTIDYSKTSQQVSLFETTIRYLAGMLSGYDLLKGPLSDLATNQDDVEALLTQSKNLADVLKFAFDSPTGIPYNNLNITSKGNDGETTNGLATIGSLVLEWTHLSDLTGDQEYAELSQKGESYLLKPEPSSAEPFPGLVGSNVNIDTGLFADGDVSWGGGDDSFYEYLLKMYVYDPNRFSTYKDRWILAAQSTMNHLKSSPSSRPDLTFLATYSNGTLGLNSQHLTCFDGGNFLLGGDVLGRPDFIGFGLELVDGCHDTYIETATRIGPEQFGWDANAVPADQQQFYERAGFYIESGAYILRPEVIESYYYAYRITGDTKYRDWAWDAFVHINATCRTDSGFSGITNVNAVGGGSKDDNQESFLFAEVMKYSYLIQAGDDEWQVSQNGKNGWVFNTEAHPIKVASQA
ncbi:mannosyl-oligosaccharide alpha-1,2-mannosidase 1B [Paecilomyces variotii No. 5]|uniref:alpha-1,2-Mannosidase n=1 Tax=Byssochlamys spectabilis (strain No. 5 / NBRC 109023) TaxID=1356009 RepID=V5FLC1_BYSSN|nr:mannosyl-oligosaccharide alpha-1,2-mannosidase 1B [Paecilomyces variotii No. 5]